MYINILAKLKYVYRAKRENEGGKMTMAEIVIK